MTADTTLHLVAARIMQAERLTILTGAGVSAASGIPTFRGAQGLWREFRPEDLATPEAFERDPALVWEWYAWRRALVAACTPNVAHDVIARWSGRDGCQVITQNVDDLHVRAGTRNLVRLHGSLWEMRCASRGDGVKSPRSPTSKASGFRESSGCGARAWRDEQVPLLELPPRCPHCNGLARPAVVWFGESLSARNVDAALGAARCDVFITIGTSAVVYPAAGLVHEARRHGALTVEINTETTPASDTVDLAILGPAEDLLARLDRRISSPD